MARVQHFVDTIVVTETPCIGLNALLNYRSTLYVVLYCCGVPAAAVGIIRRSRGSFIPAAEAAN